MPNRIFTTSLTAGALAAAATLIVAQPAASQGRLCGQRDQVVEQLKSVHGEYRQNVGLQPNARVMETFANPETGSWTILVSLPSGLSCLVAAGEAYQVDAADIASSAEDDPA